jgi:tetratricopeptide (TPR) repeat protein
MMHRILISVLFGCTLCPGLWAQPSQKSYRPGDEEFATLNYQSAAAMYDSSLRATPDDSAAILWRLARVHVCMGEVEEGKQSEHHYRLAERYAHRAVQLDSMSADARTWYAAALGSVALHAGAKTKVQLAHEIRLEVDRAIALNPENDIAYAILGSFHRALAGLSWIERQLAAIFVGRLPEGTYEDGERALKRAIEINPHAARHYYELGLLYLDWGKPDLAKQMLARVPFMPIAVARDINNKADAERRLEKLAAR